MITNAPRRPTHYRTRYKHDLSPRQREVIDLVARGRTNAEIAEALGLSLDGAKWHLREILTKLNVDSREEAAAYWHEYNRPVARLARAFGALSFGGATLKAVLIGGGTVVAGLAVAAGIAGIVATRGDDGSDLSGGVETPTSTPTASPSPGATPAPQTGRSAAEAFARQFATRVDQRDFAGILADLGTPSDWECPPGSESGPGGPFPLCNDATGGESRSGYQVVLAGGSGEVASAEQAVARLANWLRPNAELASLGCDADAAECERFIVVFANPVGELPQYTAIAFDRVGGVPRITGLGAGGDNADTVLGGGTTNTVFEATEFVPLAP